MTSMGLLERRSTRGQSPSSTTTASSRSSRRAASIIINPPQQHQLPQRPDWAANNVPYHPSPMPNQAQVPAPSTTDFPPLLRNGTNAEPMQVERAKARPNGTVWNGTAVKALQQAQMASPADVIPSPPRPTVIAPLPSRTPNPPTVVDVLNAQESDPDFPRRNTFNRTVPALYDPSASRPISRASSVTRQRPGTPSVSAEMNGDDIIEAKLAAVSLSAGISIGPPPAKSALGAPSYAKIVRRD